MRRRAAATPPAAGVISYAKASVDNVAIGGAGLAPFAFTAINLDFDQSGHFSLNASGNVEIADAGIYMLHLAATGFTLPANQNSQLDVELNVIAGSVGLWSSKLSAAYEAFGSWAYRIDNVADFSVNAEGDRGLHAFMAWKASDTFPVEIECQADWLIDTVSTAATPDFRLTLVRLGAPDF